eukprot:gnl/Dysnectes_brevis/3282_a4115_772.p1 GENE.gnl/Dysnectes_brevis/3282_a4115_772~~gnl/Dysnectes_brevis/3282_a4115_772.p1  ORF type:complete len:662 (+),score=52.36 gnl/Dysnectes_brevis/3282_a4115_772:268-1986(+)
MTKQHNEDEKFIERCKSWQFFSQKDLHIRPELHVEETSLSTPFSSSIACLQALNIASTPTAQLSAICDAASALYSELKGHHPEETVGGDDFTDIWVYVVLKAAPRRLLSTLAFLKRHAQSDQLTGEKGYYLTTTQLAATVVANMTTRTLNQKRFAAVPDTRLFVPLPSLILPRCMASPTAEASTEDMEGDAIRSDGLAMPFHLLSRRVIHGYRAFVVGEWVLQPDRLVGAIIVPGSPSDSVECAELQIRRGLSTALKLGLLTHLTDCESDVGLRWAHKQDIDGQMILVTDLERFREVHPTLSLFPASEHTTAHSVKLSMLYRAMGCGKKCSVDTLEKQLAMEDRFESCYSVPLSLTLSQRRRSEHALQAETIVNSDWLLFVQRLLSLLDLFSGTNSSEISFQFIVASQTLRRFRQVLQYTPPTCVQSAVIEQLGLPKVQLIMGIHPTQIEANTSNWLTFCRNCNPLEGCFMIPFMSSDSVKSLLGNECITPTLCQWFVSFVSMMGAFVQFAFPQLPDFENIFSTGFYNYQASIRLAQILLKVEVTGTLSPLFCRALVLYVRRKLITLIHNDI